MKVSLNGGDAVELADVTSFRGGTWSQDAETIYYTPLSNGGLWKVSADGGGQPERLSTPDRDGYDMEHEWPDALPGGTRLLYSSCCWPERIMVLDLKTGRRHQLIENGFFPRYASSGHILFAWGGSLLAARFDPVSLEVGTPEEILEDLVTGNDHPAEYAVSPSGNLVYLSGISDAERTLVRVDAEGTVERLAANAYVDPMRLSLSPDGQRLALSMRRGPGVEALANVSQADVYLYDLVRGTFDRLTQDPHGDWNPIWKPNGRDVVFQSVRGGPADLYVRPADRSAPATLLYASDLDKWPRSWSPDGTLLAFEQRDPATGSIDTWIYSIEAPDKPEPFLNETFNEGNPAFSPDGQWLAYQSDELGQFEIHVVPYPGPRQTCRVSTAGGQEPRWSGDGTKLYYRQGNTAMVADVSDRDFCNATPRTLFDGLAQWAWDVSRSGDFFVTVESREPPQLRVVLNWTEELKRLVPID